LKVALQTATATEFDLDKEETTYDDLLDAFMLSILTHDLGVKRVGSGGGTGGRGHGGYV
jgi:hypothetical protein